MDNNAVIKKIIIAYRVQLAKLTTLVVVVVQDFFLKKKLFINEYSFLCKYVIVCIVDTMLKPAKDIWA